MKTAKSVFSFQTGMILAVKGEILSDRLEALLVILWRELKLKEREYVAIYRRVV